MNTVAERLIKVVLGHQGPNCRSWVSNLFSVHYFKILLDIIIALYSRLVKENIYIVYRQIVVKEKENFYNLLYYEIHIFSRSFCIILLNLSYVI